MHRSETRYSKLTEIFLSFLFFFRTNIKLRSERGSFVAMIVGTVTETNHTFGNDDDTNPLKFNVNNRTAYVLKGTVYILAFGYKTASYRKSVQL